MSKHIVVAIPARYGSSRFKGKPLAEIAGQTMLERVYKIASVAIQDLNNAQVIVCTDNTKIYEHVLGFGGSAVMTSEECKTGSDRVLNGCTQLPSLPDIIINLQGDAPMTPPSYIRSIIECLQNDDSVDVATPVLQLSWDELDEFRERKRITPFSGTTVVFNKKNHAIWFSKQIIPAIRHEQSLRESGTFSPVYKHIGLYGYQFKALQKFVSLELGHYEQLEELEQLRMLESGLAIKTIEVTSTQYPQMVSVDTQDDLQLVDQLIKVYGEPNHA